MYYRNLGRSWTILNVLYLIQQMQTINLIRQFYAMFTHGRRVRRVTIYRKVYLISPENRVFVEKDFGRSTDEVYHSFILILPLVSLSIFCLK